MITFRSTSETRLRAKGDIYSVDSGLVEIIGDMNEEDLKRADEKVTKRLYYYLWELNKEKLDVSFGLKIFRRGQDTLNWRYTKEIFGKWLKDLPQEWEIK